MYIAAILKIKDVILDLHKFTFLTVFQTQILTESVPWCKNKQLSTLLLLWQILSVINKKYIVLHTSLRYVSALRQLRIPVDADGDGIQLLLL